MFKFSRWFGAGVPPAPADASDPPTDYKFQGWMAVDATSIEGNMVWKEYKPKTWDDERDIDLQITHCGICGSDLHTLRSGWGPTTYPCVVGHEIVGRAVRVGSGVKHIKVGDRVGVGAQNDSCLGRQGDCEECSSGIENHCRHGGTSTYNSRYKYVGDGKDISYGGYADYHRAPSHFVFKIPDEIDSADAAPMLCAGITTYSPLKQNGCGPGKKVGVVGVGGLGHFGILWAKALKADKVVGISRKNAKKDDVLKMGADEYIATDDEKDWTTKHARTLDLIVCTVSSTKMPLSDYLKLLRVGGKMVQVGLPEGPLPELSAGDLISKGIFLGGSGIGAPHEIREMLQLAADKKVKPWIEQRPMAEANQAVVDMDKGMARYRYTLVHEKHAKG